MEIPAPPTVEVQEIADQLIQLAEQSSATSNPAGEIQTLAEPVVEGVVEPVVEGVVEPVVEGVVEPVVQAAAPPVANREESLEGTVQHVVATVASTSDESLGKNAQWLVPQVETAQNTQPAAAEPMDEPADEVAAAHTAQIDLAEVEAIVALAETPAPAAQLDEPRRGPTDALIAIHDAAPLPIAAHEAARPPAAAQTEQVPVDSASVQANPAQWSPLLAAQPLVLNTEDDQPLSNAVDPTLAAIQPFATRGIGATRLIGSQPIQFEPLTHSLPAAPTPIAQSAPKALHPRLRPGPLPVALIPRVTGQLASFRRFLNHSRCLLCGAPYGSPPACIPLASSSPASPLLARPTAESALALRFASAS